MPAPKSNRIGRRALLACGAIVVTECACLSIGPAAPGDVLTGHLPSSIPTEFGPWRSETPHSIVLPDPDEARAVAAAYEDVVARSYSDGRGRSVMLVIARGRVGSGFLTLHRPETCYRAQGFAVIEDGTMRLPRPFAGFDVSRMIATLPGRAETVLYWATMDGHESDVGIGQLIDLLRISWRGAQVDNYLVRISTISGDDSRAFGLLETFSAAFLSGLPNAFRRQIAP